MPDETREGPPLWVLGSIDRCAAHFFDRIAQRANPADTPIELVVKFELVINLSLAPTRSSDEGPARGTALQRETVVNHWLTIQAIRH